MQSYHQPACAIFGTIFTDGLLCYSLSLLFIFQPCLSPNLGYARLTDQQYDIGWTSQYDIGWTPEENRLRSNISREIQEYKQILV